MPDKIIGTAILDRSLRPQQLHFYRQTRNERPKRDWIPVHPAGSNPIKEPSWVYEVHGNLLHVRPSVRVTTTGKNREPIELFHNEGFWTVQFEDGRDRDLVGANLQPNTRELWLTDLDPELLQIEGDGYRVMEDDFLASAQGITFFCPVCFIKNRGRTGTHHIICWFNNRGVPATLSPGPGRWNPKGTDFDDITFVEPGSTSVLITTGCNAHFHVAQGRVLIC